MKPTRIITEQTSLTGRPDRSDRSASDLLELAVNRTMLAYQVSSFADSSSISELSRYTHI